MRNLNKSLLIGGALSLLASLIHIGIIFGGAEWYRFFGAGENMAKMAENGMLYPTAVTSTIALILAVWSLYAFSGAGLIRRLPLLRICLVLISSIFLIRGLAGVPAALLINDPYINELGITFMMWSSIICTVFGLAYVIGTVQVWSNLSLIKHNQSLQ